MQRNHLRAHVTLFHALPGEHEDAVAADLAAAAARPPFDVAVTGVRLLGRGVACTLAAAFEPGPVRARGLGLWRYLGGPWEPVGEYPFG